MPDTPPIPIAVNLITTVTPHRLAVSDEHLVVAESVLEQTIVWTLERMPDNYQFTPKANTAHPAFEWVGGDPDGIPAPVLAARQLTLHDRNSHQGTLEYRLCVTDGDGHYYTTTVKTAAAGGGNTNPRITNR